MKIAVVTVGNIEKDFSFLINFAIGEFFSSQKFKLNTKKLIPHHSRAFST